MGYREFRLPDLGEGLEEAELVTWLVAEGDTVELNQPIAEIETAKATVEIPSPYAGRIAGLHVQAGSSVQVGTRLLTIEDEGTEASPSNSVTTEGEISLEEVRIARRAEESKVVRRGQDVALSYPGVRSGPPPATPAVRKLAKDLGVDLSRMWGSGSNGRITREDVEAADRGEDRSATLWTVSVDQGTEEVPVSATRREIAGNLTRAAAIPRVTTWRTVDCLALDEFRRERDLSPLPIFVKALAETCLVHPLLSSSWTDDTILVHRRINVGIATDTERGLLVPVVKDAHSKSIGEIGEEIARLAPGAREGSLTPFDMTGETITVSNTGSYGSEAGTPLLKPGNSVTLALGVIEPRALVIEGDVVARPACTLSVTFDHRVLDGAAVGRALTDLLAILEDPERLRALPR